MATITLRTADQRLVDNLKGATGCRHSLSIRYSMDEYRLIHDGIPLDVTELFSYTRMQDFGTFFSQLCDLVLMTDALKGDAPLDPWIREPQIFGGMSLDEVKRLIGW